MMEDTRGWTHKGELIFLLLSLIVPALSFRSLLHTGDDVSLLVCIYLYANDSAGIGIVMVIRCLPLTTRRR